MRNIDIKIKGRKFSHKVNWIEKSFDSWTYNEVDTIWGQKLIDKPEWNYYIIFMGEPEEFDIEEEEPTKRKYYPPKSSLFSPAVKIAYKDLDGWYHIKTEAGYFKIRL